MEFNIDKKDNKVEVAVEGRIDTTTVSELEKGIFAAIEDENVNEIVVDFEKLEYISSVGLRLLLMLQKKMNSIDGSFTVLNANSFVMEILSITGFDEIINVKKPE